MRDFIFHNALNTKTREQQLKMIEQKGGVKVEFIVNSRSTLQPAAGQLCRGVEKHALVNLPYFRRVVVDVQEIVSADKVGEVSVVKNPEKKGLIVKVVFQKKDDCIRAIAFINGAIIEITPTGGHVQPKVDERWLVRVLRVRPVIGADQLFLATGEMVKRLPDLAQTSIVVSKPNSVQLANDDVVMDTAPDEELIELELVRGVNTTTGNKQWECRLTDSAGVTTLYVVDRDAELVPRMNGERWECAVIRQIFPKAGADNFDTSAFKIMLVEPVEKVEVALPYAGNTTDEVVDTILPKALASTGVIGNISRKHSDRTRAQIRATSGARRAETDKKHGKKKQKSA